MSENPDVVAAARVVAEAFRAHGEVMATVADTTDRSRPADAQEVVAVIEAGNSLRKAVLEYERVLMDETGWSNPIRHLGRLPAYSANDLADEGQLEGDEVRVSVKYRVAVLDEVGLAHLVDGSGGPSEGSIAEAIRYLVEKDGWDPWQYAPRILHLKDLSLSVEMEGE